MDFPIGQQDFAKIRKDNKYHYVDKTALVHKMANEGCYYFLSRPRRFGKSLLVSTLKYYFQGREDLFAGTALAQLEHAWATYEVLHISFNNIRESKEGQLEKVLEKTLTRFEQRYGITPDMPQYDMRFYDVIQAAYEKSQQGVVVLIDEYDKPLLALMEHGESYDDVRGALKAFYSVLKDCDQYLRFVLLTGITRFSKLSVFSGLNNLCDISMSPEYSTLCGLTYEEITANFQPELQRLAANEGYTLEACLQELKRSYDGYRFSRLGESVYNPFSVLSALKAGLFDDYWFLTGTPEFLVNAIAHTHIDMATALSNSVYVDLLACVDSFDQTPLPLLYQAGYLTLKDYHREERAYTLCWPNEEVRRGFLNALSNKFMGAEYKTELTAEFRRFVFQGNAQGFMEKVVDIFSHKPYVLTEEKTYERDYQNTFFLIFELLGFNAEVEKYSTRGRMDVCVQTDKLIYIFELKVDASPEAALKQIDDGAYAQIFRGSTKRKIAVGISFKSMEKGSVEYQIAELP